MGIYNSAVITNTGQALLAQSVAGNDLKFTTVKTSNYTYPSGTSLADLTTLTGIKQSKNITGATVYNSRVIKVSAMVDNAGVTAEYSINTIGVYATIGTAAEQLFAVITAQEADNMPAFNSRPYSYIYDLNMTMQGAANITVTVNNAGFVNINDLNNALDGVNDSITDLDETVNGRIDTLSSSVDTRISALNETISTLGTYTTFTPSFASSITDILIRNAQGYYNPLTKMCFLSIYIISNGGLIPTANNTICTIPDTYAPSGTIEFPALVIPKSCVDWSDVRTEACALTNNGVIRMGNFIYGATATKVFAINVTYFCR